MINLRALRDERMSLVGECRALMEAHDGNLGAEDSEKYDRQWARVEEIGATIKREERLAALESDLEHGGDDEPPGPGGGVGTSGDDGPPELREAQVKAHREIRSFCVEPHAPATLQLRALQAGDDIYGGYLYQPIAFVDRLIKAVDNAVYMRTYGTGHRVAQAGGIGFPTIETNPADADWTSELAIGDEETSMELGNRELRPHPLAKYIKVSRTLLRRAPSAEDIVNDRLGYKFAVTWENAALNGTGSNQPLGIFTNATGAGIGTAQDVSEDNTATLIKADNLINCKYKLKPQYWRSARWIFHSDAMKQIAKLKDGESRYLWQASLRDGQPDTILGRPVLVSEYCPNTFTTGLYVGALADFSWYWYVDELNFELIRLVELYAGTNQVGVVGRWESDGQPVLSEAFVRVKLG